MRAVRFISFNSRSNFVGGLNFAETEARRSSSSSSRWLMRCISTSSSSSGKFAVLNLTEDSGGRNGRTTNETAAQGFNSSSASFNSVLAGDYSDDRSTGSSRLGESIGSTSLVNESRSTQRRIGANSMFLLPSLNSHRLSNRAFSTEVAAATSKPSTAVEEKVVEAPKKKPVIDSRVWPIAASTLVGGCAVGVLFPVMPIFVQELGLSSKDFGLVVSIVGLTRLMVNIPAAWLTDKYGRRFTLIGGPIISGIGMALTSSARSLLDLVGVRFLTGLGGSFQMTGAQMYLSDISTPENRARTMAPMGIAFATGATIGPALGGYMSEAYGLRAPFMFVTTAIALVAMLNYRLVPETRKLPSPSAVDNGQPKASVWEEFKQVSKQWRPLLQNPDIRNVLQLHLTYWSVVSGCSWTLLPLLASESFGFSVSDLGKMFAFISAIGIVGLGPASIISDKFGRKVTILPAAVLVSASLAMIPLASTKEGLLAFVATYAIGSTLFSSTPQAFVADITTEENRGQALAMLRSAGDAGLFIGAGGFGALSHATSPTIAFGCASTALMFAGAKFVWSARDTKKK